MQWKACWNSIRLLASSAKLTQLSAFSLFVTKNNSFSLCVSKCGDDERSFSSQFWITHLMASVRHKITNQQKQLNESFHPSPTLSLSRSHSKSESNRKRRWCSNKKRYRVTKQLHIIFIRASSSIDFLLSLIFRMESGNLVVFFSLRHLISQFHDYLNDQAGLLRDVYAKRHTIPFSLDGSISETHFRVRRFQYVYSVLVRALDHHSKCKC